MLLDNVPANGESWFCGRAFRLAAIAAPRLPYPKPQLALELTGPGNPAAA